MNLDIKQIEQFLNKNNILKYKFIKITEEGSNRAYYRILDNNTSYVLCITYPFLENYDDFIILTKYLIKKDRKVPKIIDIEPAKGYILLEDGGSYYLQDIVRSNHSNKKKVISIYKKIIDELIEWHFLDEIPDNVKNRFFDRDKFQFEIDFCIDKIKKNHLPLPPFEFQVFLEEVIEFLCKQKEYVFTHRDFHSRNIIYKNVDSDFKIIDYQDARMGLCWYDLSSLLFDPYVKLDLELVLELFDDYYIKSQFPNNKKIHYKNIFLYQAFQRLFKALGSFLYLGFDLKKNHFLNYVIPDLEQMIIISQIGRFPDCIYLYCKTLLDSIDKLKIKNEN
jgi:aminoglycoside/choline kinase family phosphotransferase